MRLYLVRRDWCNYLANGSTPSHGFTGYLNTSQSDYSYVLNEWDPTRLTGYSSVALGHPVSNNHTALAELLGQDMNSVDPEKDNTLGVLTSHKHSRGGVPFIPSNYIHAFLAEERRFPLTLQLNTLATKIIFDNLGCSSKKTS
ncbi:hypothetical protein CDEST_14566 [Colletotrichum destructivum]|uniref:Uncharacterized protein n=1 Tax=Colletotrichum destructivum TaxID=34406 RepID=A0AAX4J2G8_9PEZI|nr:hypothetical protein CDEST_14566 [Colletotrichum destructivum]